MSLPLLQSASTPVRARSVAKLGLGLRYNQGLSRKHPKPRANLQLSLLGPVEKASAAMCRTL